MDISIISIGTIVLSEILKYYNSNILYKNLADLGLKINMNRFNEDFSDYDESNYDFTSLVPFANVFKQFLDRYNYIQDFDFILTELNKKGYLEKMTESELEYYNKNRSLKRAININENPELVDFVCKNDIERKEIKKELKYEYVITYSYFEDGENSISFITKRNKNGYKIVNSSGPVALKSKIEQKEKISELQYKIVEYIFNKNYGKDISDIIENISMDDINEAVNHDEEKIEMTHVLKKDLRKMR